MAKITVTTTYEVSYYVHYYEHAEGGMDSGGFGKLVNTLEQALVLLETAQAQDETRDWQICLDVTKTVGHNPKQG